MKYRPSEQTIVDNVNAQIKRLKKIQLSKSNQVNKLNKEINEIDKTVFTTAEPIRIIDKKIRKRCKHKGGTHKGGTIFRDFSPKNMRYIFCDDCEESIGSEDV